MAAAFAALPCKVLWRLTPKEVPDEAAIASLGLGSNTQVLASAALANVDCAPAPDDSTSKYSRVVLSCSEMYEKKLSYVLCWVQG